MTRAATYIRFFWPREGWDTLQALGVLRLKGGFAGPTTCNYSAIQLSDHLDNGTNLVTGRVTVTRTNNASRLFVKEICRRVLSPLTCV